MSGTGPLPLPATYDSMILWVAEKGLGSVPPHI